MTNGSGEQFEQTLNNCLKKMSEFAENRPGGFSTEEAKEAALTFKWTKETMAREGLSVSERPKKIHELSQILQGLMGNYLSKGVSPEEARAAREIYDLAKKIKDDFELTDARLRGEILPVY